MIYFRKEPEGGGSMAALLDPVRREAEIPVKDRPRRSAAAVPEKRRTYDDTFGREFEADTEYESVVIREIKTKQKRKKIKYGILLKVSLVFALGLLVVFRYASITEIGYRVSEAQTEYNQLLAENERIEVAIKSELNLAEIQKLAKEKFDMQQPQTYQIVVLDVEPTDQTEILSQELPEPSDERAWYEKIYDGLRGFLGLI